MISDYLVIASFGLWLLMVLINSNIIVSNWLNNLY